MAFWLAVTPRPKPSLLLEDEDEDEDPAASDMCEEKPMAEQRAKSKEHRRTKSSFYFERNPRFVIVGQG